MMERRERHRYLAHYRIAVQHPDVSGFETLDTLMTRDKLLEQDASLTSEEKAQLAAADQQLLAHARKFYAELEHITNLEYERQQRKPTPAQWWWYLDVLLQLPATPARLSESMLMLA